MLGSSLKTNMDASDAKRLLLVSSKCKYGALLEKAVKANVIAILYSYENSTFDTLLALVSACLGNGEKVVSVGCVMTSKHAGVFMLHLDANKGILGAGSAIRRTDGIGMFFKLLFSNYVDSGHAECRLDFFGAAVVNQLEKSLRDVERIIGAPVGVSKDPLGIDETVIENGNKLCLGDMYFTSEKIRNWSNGSYQTIDLFEKIRVVGKGAFGTAVLYRKKDDNSLVILKEMNMTELNSQERQLAMNETRVLKMLNHPNIICYYDTFEENGVLMIEMEYADNGTLAQLLNKQETPLREKEILIMFSQIVSGIRYMHERKVLHRDLKTANIFLTKDGFIKIGDFGVSKIMSSHSKGANTVLGTPYYISPEICEGKEYDEKSDIWALGCILHEMATRQKTFEGTNLPALVNKIMKGQIAPIQGDFTSDFRQLVHDMLHREPDMRPSAHVLDCKRLPEIMSFYDRGDGISVNGKLSSNGSLDVSSYKDVRSVLYLYDTDSLGISPVDGFPTRIKIRQVAVGQSHMIVVAMERIVYSWGNGNHGQLGHGITESMSKPKVVEALKGKSVVSACCGALFSAFISDNGIVMTCGDGQNGCLGHGDYSTALRPRLIEKLLGVDVACIACGLRHVVALGSEGEVYSWGNGEHGGLGTGDLDIHEYPTEVMLGAGTNVREVRCGRDSTMLITDVGTLFACGSNKYNKLGLNERRGFLTALSNRLKLEVDFKKKPTAVKSIKGVMDVSMGANHTAILTESGAVFMFGDNSYGQIGTGDDKVHNFPYFVKTLRKYEIAAVVCGDTYTAAGTSDGLVLFWGKDFKQPSVGRCLSASLNIEESRTTASMGTNLLVKPAHRRTRSNASTISFQSAISLTRESDSPSRSSSFQDVSSFVCDGATNHVPCSEIDSDSNASTPVNNQIDPFDSHTPEKIFTPTPVLVIQGSPGVPELLDSSSEDIVVKSSTGVDDFTGQSSNISSNFAAFLIGLIPSRDNFYILVETNAPSSLKQEGVSSEDRAMKGVLKSQISCLNLLVPDDSQQNSTSSSETGDECPTSELSSFGTAPTWIKEELKSLETLDSAKLDSSRSVKHPTARRGKSDGLSSDYGKANQTTYKLRRIPSPSSLKPKSTPQTETQTNVENAVMAGRGNVSAKNSAADFGEQERNVRKLSGRRNSSISPYVRRSPHVGLNRLRRNGGRSPNWPAGNTPKRGKSPIRRSMVTVDRDIHARCAKLQKEKHDAEMRMKILQAENEKHLQEMKVLHEREKFEQEQKLHGEIAMLRRELERQQQQMKEHCDVAQHLKRGHRSELVKNSKICNVQ